MRDVSSAEVSWSGGEFARFHTIVLEDSALLAVLRAAETPEQLARRAIEEGRKRGCEFHSDDVLAALVVARRTWAERRTQ
jgi:hypothetical protein